MSRARTVLRALFLTAVAVSVVHYFDNVANHGDYPQPDGGFAPSAAVIAASWFAFTAFGVAGYRAFLRGRLRHAAILLAVYAGSGLVGLGHYTVPGAEDMPWWRHAHVVADIVLGTAMLAFAVWTGRRSRASAHAPIESTRAQGGVY